MRHQLFRLIRETMLRPAAIFAALLLAGTGAVRAHEGPPFPIIVDEAVGPYVVSVWTDPDIGTGTFFVVLEPQKGREMLAPRGVRVAVRPESGRLPEATYDAEPQAVRYGARYYAEVAFDEGGMWKVRITIDGVEGGGELHTVVEPTPDGTIGPAGLILYLLPFLAVGFLWMKAAMRKGKTPSTPLADA